jgi:CubicO group peptidase (beta-lactamase class C family)
MQVAASADAIGLSQARLDRAYDFLDEKTATGQIAGAALLVARHGQPLPARAFGRLRPQTDSPVQPDTIFLVASVTKPVTATALMLLVERGKLLLDEHVSSVLPEFGRHHSDAKAQVCIRHLLTHTSGLPDMLPENIELRRQLAPLSEFVRRMVDVRLDFAPGSEIQYQSFGLALLGAIVERIEGVSLPEFLEREIFGPLGMSSTALGIRALPVERVAEVNVAEQNQEPPWDWNSAYWRNFAAPWGGMFTTAGDIYRFCQMFLNRGQWDGVSVLSPATVAAMTQDQTSNMPTVPALSRYQQAWGLGWGMAWRRDPARSWSFFGDLCSRSSYGHGGATGCVVWVDPVRELICVLLTTEPSAIHQGWLGRCSNLVAAAAT